MSIHVLERFHCFCVLLWSRMTSRYLTPILLVSIELKNSNFSSNMSAGAALRGDTAVKSKTHQSLLLPDGSPEHKVGPQTSPDQPCDPHKGQHSAAWCATTAFSDTITHTKIRKIGMRHKCVFQPIFDAYKCESHTTSHLPR